MKKQMEPAAIARLVVPPRWQSTRAALASAPSASADEGADQRERVEVDALGLQPGGLHGGDVRDDHGLARGHDHDPLAQRAVGGLGAPMGW